MESHRKRQIMMTCGALLVVGLLQAVAYGGVSSYLQIYLTTVLGTTIADATSKVTALGGPDIAQIPW